MNARSSQPDQPSSRSRIFPRGSHDDDLFREQQRRIVRTTDQAFAIVLAMEWVAAIGVAVWISPLAWKGLEARVHEHVWAAVGLGGLFALVPIASIWLNPGTPLTRHLVAIGQMLMTALFIHLTGGRIETHFMVFGSLAFLAFYRDWKVLMTATLVVVIDHALRGAFFPQSVYGTSEAPLWRTLEHTWWVGFEDIFLFFAIFRANQAQQGAALDKVREMGQYQLKERLGLGGMGVVYLAEHRLLKRPCAIKLVRRDLARDPATLARFEREVQSMAGLTHPNTVAIYDYGHLDDGTFYYVMEYLQGPNLQELVEYSGALPPARAVYLLRQLCQALYEAHAMGLIHRDIKPHNVLVCQQGRQHDVPKLLDFGLVRTALGEVSADARLTQADAVLGTPHYMSPEQVTGDTIDNRSDLYSLGVLAYFLLTARQPFEGANSQAVMYARIQGEAPPPTSLRSDIPTDLEQVVLKCLARRPDDRYGDARALERALATCGCCEEWSEDHAARWWEGWLRHRAMRSALPEVPLQSTDGEAVLNATRRL